MPKKKIINTKCQTQRCKRKTKQGRALCATCMTRKWRAEHPMETAYMNLRNNAVRRNKIFTLSFEKFKELCIETQYLAGKGRTRKSFTIDCKIPELGYTDDNVGVLTKGDNCSKGTRISYLNYDYITNTAIVIKMNNEPLKEGMPF